MNKKRLVMLLSISLLCSCGGIEDSKVSSSFYSEEDKASSSLLSSLESSQTSSTSYDSSSNEVSSSTLPSSMNPENFIRTINAAGSYTFSGNVNGSILIDAPETDEVEVVLNGATITSTDNSPIYCKSAGELKIKLIGNNVINDNRMALDSSNEDPLQGKGAIYSKCDLKITSTGSLTVNASYNNGIHSTDDIKFKSTGTINVTSINHAVKGNDSITVESGTINLISKCGSGLKTENTSISSKGNQKGSINITGGDITISSCEDAIEAAYDVVIENEPKLDIKTSSYSPYTIGSISGSGNDQSATKMYLRTSNNTYNYSVQFKNSSNVLTWRDAAYSTMKQGGRGSYYYFYELSKPSDATSMKVFLYQKSVTTRNESTALASSSFITINPNYDTAVLSVSSSNVSCSQWTNFTTQQGGGGFPGGPGGGMQEGNNDKADYSAKGIKSDNEIFIRGGEISVKAYDDAVHAGRGAELENGSTGLGNVHISGGDLSLYASDDGIHADNINDISGGVINVTNSYEGIEGNIINISGGTVKVYSTDDGLNAANKAGVSPEINISGGTIDITVYGGDVDGIDSNNTYTQTGGLVITKGGNGGMSTGLDTDGTARVSSGTLIVFGRPENNPTLGTGVTSYTLSGSYSIGTYVVSNTVNTVDVTTKYSYSAIYVYSSETNRYTVTRK
ncbi:MAG: carbohydrate-binding domain-containing protein [Bacilli bacterium]|nr:carbohydrate-binding domain-containing protein [Bacilli bacterium]